MVKGYLMKCGHIAFTENNQNPIICDRCGCMNIDKEITNITTGLEGRMARCSECGRETPSRWNLPLFTYEPDLNTDKYYCGCYGWD